MKDRLWTVMTLLGRCYFHLEMKNRFYDEIQHWQNHIQQMFNTPWVFLITRILLFICQDLVCHNTAYNHKNVKVGCFRYFIIAADISAPGT